MDISCVCAWMFLFFFLSFIPLLHFGSCLSFKPKSILNERNPLIYAQHELTLIEWVVDRNEYDVVEGLATLYHWDVVVVVQNMLILFFSLLCFLLLLFLFQWLSIHSTTENKVTKMWYFSFNIKKLTYMMGFNLLNKTTILPIDLYSKCVWFLFFRVPLNIQRGAQNEG